VLGTLLGSTAIAGFFLARSSSLSPTPLLPPGSSGVIALDVSGSVEGATLDRIYASLSQLANSDGRFGMVVFSSRAYEALPPDTPARELKPLTRFFHPVSRKSLVPGKPPPVVPFTAFYPANPWQIGFDTGTEISKGLELSRDVVVGDSQARREVWLISDLADDPHDFGQLAKVAKTYIQLGIALNIVALNPKKSDLRRFEKFLGPNGTVIQPKPSSKVRLARARRFPTWFIVDCAILALLLAGNELWNSPLRWGFPERAPAR